MKKKGNYLAVLTMPLLIAGVLSGCGKGTANGEAADKSVQNSSGQNSASTEIIESTTEPTVKESNQTLSERLGGKLYVGDEFTLGTYEQDNDLKNGAEDITWVVLEKTGENAYLCISKYVLDAQPFHNQEYYGADYWSDDDDIVYNNWGTSSLRLWLNNDFFNTAFTSEDQKNITDTVNQVYVWQTTKDNNLSKEKYSDKVCLINWGQLDEFPGCVKITEYAKAQGVPFVDDGTREHENCSDGWVMMSMNVDANKELIDRYNKNYEENKHLGFSCVESSRGLTLDPARYEHTKIGYRGKGETRYIWGIRPVITVNLGK